MSEREWAVAQLRQGYVNERVSALLRVLRTGYSDKPPLTWEKLLEYFRDVSRQSEGIYP